MTSYFFVFDLPATFNLDLKDLEKRYFAAQRTFHPDRLVGKSPAQQQQAIVKSMLINEAHDALKNPLKRAQHMLDLADAPEQKPSQALLMEIMELRELLMQLEAPETLDKLEQTVADSRQATLASLSVAFGISDYAQAAELTMRLSYLIKLEDEVRIRKKAIAIDKEVPPQVT